MAGWKYTHKGGDNQMRNKRYIGASRRIAAERYDYSDGERMGQPIANKEIQIRNQAGNWVRYTVTWPEFVNSTLREAEDRGYEARVVDCSTKVNAASMGSSPLLKDFKFIGNSWRDLISHLEEQGYTVTKGKSSPTKWLYLTKNGDEYEAEVTNYYPGGYEILKYNINKVGRIQASTIMAAVDDEEFEDPRIDEADELQSRVEDDFDYVITGIERLGREGLLDEAISLLNTLADTLDSAIGIIGNDFEAGEELPEESEEI